jgi:glucose-6-phosphate dehydrogenase assembly protein OpcA
MEDVMTNLATLLQHSKEVPFSELEGMLASGRDAVYMRQTSAPRASTATVVVVGTPERLEAAIDAISALGEASGVRAILIAEGTSATPTVRMTESFVAIDGLSPEYLNNAVAAVRLPSLPALIWWRGGSQQALEEVTHLADRLVLDTEDPESQWARADRLLPNTALTDLRWTRLTRWRAVLAHLFDLRPVRDTIGGFHHVAIETSDPPSGRLFGAWLVSCLGQDVDVKVSTISSDGRSSLDAVRLEGDHLSIAIRRLPGRECLEATLQGEVADVRVAPLGHATLSECLSEELGVRSRDLAFERALGALVGLQEQRKLEES